MFKHLAATLLLGLTPVAAGHPALAADAPAPVPATTTAPAMTTHTTAHMPAPAAAHMASPTPVPATSPVKAEPEQDAAFLEAVHQANMFEISGSRIAVKRSPSKKVRQLATTFITDHKKIDSRLVTVAKKAGVSLPKSVTTDQATQLKEYAATPVDKFDALFLTTQVTAHADAAKAGAIELDKGSDPRVKALVKFAAPIVLAHHKALLATEKAMHLGKH